MPRRRSMRREGERGNRENEEGECSFNALTRRVSFAALPPRDVHHHVPHLRVRSRALVPYLMTRFAPRGLSSRREADSPMHCRCANLYDRFSCGRRNLPKRCQSIRAGSVWPPTREWAAALFGLIIRCSPHRVFPNPHISSIKLP